MGVQGMEAGQLPEPGKGSQLQVFPLALFYTRLGISPYQAVRISQE